MIAETSSRVSDLVKKISEDGLSQKDKISIIKDCFKGQRAFLVSCGPSLLDHDQDEIKSLLKNNLVFGIKQTFDLYKEFIDVHFLNCANFKTYDYSEYLPLVLKSASEGFPYGFAHLNFTVKTFKKHASDFEISTVNFKRPKDLKCTTFENAPNIRMCGPGLIYELVFPAILHFGVSELITIGWDSTIPKNMSPSYSHFYDLDNSPIKEKDSIQFNRVSNVAPAAKSIPGEMQGTVRGLDIWYEWFKMNNCDLKILSPYCNAPNFMKINSLKDV